MIGWHGPSIGKDDAATYAADVFSYIIYAAGFALSAESGRFGPRVGVSFGYYTQRNVGPDQPCDDDHARKGKGGA